ncbi:MAG: hypothetical protein Q4B14_04875 [Clostridia bacterium]|nr:hypothetical protein [Clostridia bacterium]
MIDEIEKLFIERFIKKNRQDRLLFELSGKKRQNGIGRFCHYTEDLIKPDRIVASGNKLYSDEILSVAEKYNVSGLCYIIAYNKNLDRKTCTLNDALNLVLGNGMAGIIICDNLVVIETEQSFGTPTRYILH